MKHIHIISSSPRSGTTLIMELMKVSFNVDLAGPFEERIGKMPLDNADIYLTKAPRDTVVIKPILEKVKSIYVIFMIRDPRDMTVSYHKEHPGNFHGSLEYWHNYMAFYDDIKDHECLITIRYEDLVQDPNKVQLYIAEKFPFLKITNKFSEYDKLAKPSFSSLQALHSVRKIDTKSIGNWRNFKPRIKAEILKYGSVSDDLIKFGYETDKEWEKELEDLEPDFDNQHYSIFSTDKFIRQKQRFKLIRLAKVWFYHTGFFLSLLSAYRRIFGKSSEAHNPSD